MLLNKMKVAQVIQLLSLVTTIATAEAYDAPYGSGEFIGGSPPAVALTFVLPKSDFTEVNIYHQDYHMDMVRSWLTYQPSGDHDLVRYDNDNDISTAWVSAYNVELNNHNGHESAEIDVVLPADQLKNSDLNFLVSLNGPEGVQSFPVNITVTEAASLSTISSTATSNSPGPTTDITPFGSAYYYEDNVYYDMVLPKSDFSKVYIYAYNHEKESYQAASGVYSPSGRSFEVSLNDTKNYDYPTAYANVSFSEDDKSVNISIVSLTLSPFNEYLAEFMLTYNDTIVGPELSNIIILQISVTSSSSATSSSPVTLSSSTTLSTITSNSSTDSSSIISGSPTSSPATVSNSPGPTTDTTPFGSAYYYEDHVYYDIVFPKSDFSKLYIFPYDREQDDYRTASGVYSPSDRTLEVYLNNTKFMDSAVVSANVSFSESDLFANISLVSLRSSPFEEYVKKFLISYDDSLFSGPKLFASFVLSLTVTSLGTSSSSSTTSSTITTSSSTHSSSTSSSSSTTSSPPGPTDITPFGSGYYHEDHIYYDIMFPKYNFHNLYIYPEGDIEGVYQKASGVYSPSDRPFEVSFDNTANDGYPKISANISFSEDDVFANVSLVSLISSPFTEYAAEFMIFYDYDPVGPVFIKQFFLTLTISILGASSSSLMTSSLTTLSSSTTLSTITTSSSTSVIATTSTSSTTIPTPPSFTPYGSASYYEDKVYFDFVFPNANYTRMRMSQNFAGPFTYVLDTVSGVYSPSSRSFDVNTVSVGWGVNMRVDAFTFSPDDISANISWVCSSTSPFAEGVFKFQYFLDGGSDSGGDLMTVTVSSLDASPTPLAS